MTKRWTPQEELELKHRYERGGSPWSLAVDHGRPPGGVVSRLTKLKLAYWDDESKWYYDSKTSLPIIDYRTLKRLNAKFASIDEIQKGLEDDVRRSL